MSKSAIYTVNNSAEAITANSIIPIGTTIRRFGQNIRQDGNSIILCDKVGCAGYYKVDIVATINPSVSSDYAIVLEKDGVPVIGGIAEVIATTATNYILPISVIVKNSCGGSSALSVVLKSKDTAKITNMTVSVVRL